MRHPSLLLKSSRPTPWLGVATVSAAVALAALGPQSAAAQVIYGTGQRGVAPGTPVQSMPVPSQRPTFMPSPGPVYRMPQASQQNIQTQFYQNGFRPAYPTVPTNNVDRSGTSDGGASVSGQDQTRRFYSNQMPGTLPAHRAPAPPATSQIFHSVQTGVGGHSVQVTTPDGQRSFSYRNDNNYLYSPVIVVDGPSLLGGYYYGNYTDTYDADVPCYPSIYSTYPGFPQYIVNPGVIVLGEPYYPSYVTPPQPFYAPVYQVTYNQNNYYVASEDRAQQIQDGGASATRALKNAYPADSYQAAFSDIQQAWKNGDIEPLRKHIRDSDTTLSVYFKGKYSYSIASGDFVKITRDALDRLSTVSFDFTRLRKAKNGDVTAYGKHVYRAAGGSDSSADGASIDSTVPFSADGPASAGTEQPYDKADDPASGAEKTAYVSYTLRKHDDQWYIIGVDSSPTDLLK